MVTGLNTDIEHDGRVFHVQTEDRDPESPVLRTIIYCSGQVLTVVNHSYEELVTEGEVDRKAVAGRLVAQHKRMILDLRADRLEVEEPAPFVIEFAWGITVEPAPAEAVEVVVESAEVVTEPAPTAAILEELDRRIESAPVTNKTKRPRSRVPALAAVGLALLTAVAFLALRGRIASEAPPAPRPTPASSPVALVEPMVSPPIAIVDHAVPPPQTDPEPFAPPPEPVVPEPIAPEAVAPEPVAAEPVAAEPIAAEPIAPPAEPQVEALAPEPEPESAEPVPEPPARVRPGDLVELSEVDVRPRPISRALPQYSKFARKKKHQGSVELTLLIDEQGAVQHVELVRGINGSDLNESAIASARDWRFQPARSAGVPVQVWIPVVFDFSIERGQTLVRLQR